MTIKKYPKKNEKAEKADKPVRQFSYDSQGVTWEVHQRIRQEVDAIPGNLWKPWTVHPLPCGVLVLAIGEPDPPASMAKEAA